MDVNRKWRSLKTRVWRFDSNFEYPEIVEYKTYLEGKMNVGIALSGGGTRAATAGLGYLRGLRDIGLLQKARYLSSNSGGTWVAAAYTWFQGDDNTFFSPYTRPEDMTEQKLLDIPKDCFLYNVTRAGIILDSKIGEVIHKDESYGRVLGKIFLKRLNIPYKKRCVAYNYDSVKKILQRNPSLDVNDFFTVGENRPFYIANGTLHNMQVTGTNASGQPVTTWAKPGAAFHIEMTPLYSGIRVYHAGKGDGGADIGGGVIESFALDSELKQLDDDKHEARVGLISKFWKSPLSRFIETRKMFTVSDILAISGAAPSKFDEWLEYNKAYNVIKYAPSVRAALLPVKFYLPILDTLPEMNHWSVEEAYTEEEKTREYNLGDGGTLDDMGVIPLFCRGVPKIISFVNTPYKLLNKKGMKAQREDSDGFAQLSKEDLFNSGYIRGDDDLAQYFGLTRRGEPIADPKLQSAFQVLEETPDGDNYKTLIHALVQRGDSAPVYTGSYKVINNDFYGIRNSYPVEIMWFYLDRCIRWEWLIGDKNITERIGKADFGEIYDEFDDLVGEQHNRYRNFPNYRTFLENFPKVIDLEADQANLLANYATWIVHENRQQIEDFTG